MNRCGGFCHSEKTKKDLNMKNNSLKEIAKVLKNAETIVLYPHVNPDGDTIGSSSALCKALRKLGKTCYILMKENLPDNMAFTDQNPLKVGPSYFINEVDSLEVVDVSMCLDCGELGRFPDRIDEFKKGTTSICIDHHDTSKGNFDYNYIDSKSAATGALVFDLIKELKVEMDAEMGEALFLAITTDTGNFQYSNTDKKCHEIMAELYDIGVDVNKVSTAIYENVRPEKYLVLAHAMNNLRLISYDENSQPLAAMAHIDLKTLKNLEALPEETDDIVEKLRSIKGVEIGVFLKEKETGVIRVSMRAKSKGNVAEIAKKFNGGGHVKAAGCTLYMTMDEAIKVMTDKVREALKNL